MDFLGGEPTRYSFEILEWTGVGSQRLDLGANIFLEIYGMTQTSALYRQWVNLKLPSIPCKTLNIWKTHGFYLAN